MPSFLGAIGNSIFIIFLGTFPIFLGTFPFFLKILPASRARETIVPRPRNAGDFSKRNENALLRIYFD